MNPALKNEFDLKAGEWDKNPMHWERSEAVARQILDILPLKPWMRGLEYGAGTGITSFILKEYLKEITMVDFSLEMIRIINEKIKASGAGNLKTMAYNLEKERWNGDKFDLIFTQMVLHHIIDIDNIISKFHGMLNPGGFLAIADLYPEDGSFHGQDFSGHKGFNTKKLAQLISKNYFEDITYRKCFTITKNVTDRETRQFDVFLLTARRPKIHL